MDLSNVTQLYIIVLSYLQESCRQLAKPVWVSCMNGQCTFNLLTSTGNNPASVPTVERQYAASSL